MVLQFMLDIEFTISYDNIDFVRGRESRNERKYMLCMCFSIHIYYIIIDVKFDKFYLKFSSIFS
jgi:hypothetical protein